MNIEEKNYDNVQSRCRKSDKQYETNELHNSKVDKGQADENEGERTELYIF